jgi:DNA repair protein RadC
LLLSPALSPKDDNRQHGVAHEFEVIAVANHLGDALRHNATGIILAHSHPSGYCRPSGCDIATTRRLAQVAQALDIALVDHLIFTADAVYSMRAGGLL